MKVICINNELSKLILDKIYKAENNDISITYFKFMMKIKNFLVFSIKNDLKLLMK